MFQNVDIKVKLTISCKGGCGQGDCVATNMCKCRSDFIGVNCEIMKTTTTIAPTNPGDTTAPPTNPVEYNILFSLIYFYNINNKGDTTQQSSGGTSKLLILIFKKNNNHNLAIVTAGGGGTTTMMPAEMKNEIPIISIIAGAGGYMNHFNYLNYFT